MEFKTEEYFKTSTDKKIICLERVFDTTKKILLETFLGDKFNAF
jgi:adenine-specific DNA-methyltransferase